MINIRFNQPIVNSFLGGHSSLEVGSLGIQSLAEAKDFALAYGFDTDNEEDVKRLWYYQDEAIAYLEKKVLNQDEFIPDELKDKTKNPLDILIYASQTESHLQKWSCVVLKVIHALILLQNDLFKFYSDEIQEGVFGPVEKHIFHNDDGSVWLGKPNDEYSVELHRFEKKTFKNRNSAITKMLSKPDITAFGLMDQLGIRFLTKNVFDVFRVVRFLHKKNIISFSHNIPNQTNNTLYPLNLFFESLETLSTDTDYSSEEINTFLNQKLKTESERAEFLEKRNPFTDNSYRFIKFISRRLIKLKKEEGKKRLGFFYPYEVQILDYDSHVNNETGASSHDEYKKRQIKKVRLRLFGMSPIERQRKSQ